MSKDSRGLKMKSNERARKIAKTVRKDSDTVSQAMGEAQTYVAPKILKKLLRKTVRNSR